MRFIIHAETTEKEEMNAARIHNIQKSIRSNCITCGITNDFLVKRIPKGSEITFNGKRDSRTGILAYSWRVSSLRQRRNIEEYSIVLNSGEGAHDTLAYYIRKLMHEYEGWGVMSILTNGFPRPRKSLQCFHELSEICQHVYSKPHENYRQPIDFNWIRAIL